MNESLSYPFSAIVGQRAMKRALTLAAIHPGLGGVLIRGSKGAAKSTAVRALAEILPAIEVYEGDPFHRAVGEEIEGWPLLEGARIVERPVELVNLPMGATDDRVVGALNIERALATGLRAFEPGLLARAHRGLLYIDEVNLLADHLVDLLLDVAAMGVNHVEREGLTFRHPSRFVLVGTMNPEEGDLRPQLLDRFGLAVEVEPMTDPASRAEVVRRRLAFEADPLAFRDRWDEADRDEGRKIVEAQALLPSVVVPPEVLEALCARCAREGAEGLRADLTIYKAASALAAYEGRSTVTHADVDAVAELALAHRRTTPPGRGPSPPPPPNPSGDRSSPEGKPREGSPSSENSSQETPSPSLQDQGILPRGGGESESERIDSADPSALSPWTPSRRTRQASSLSGRRGNLGATDRQGIMIRSEVPNGRATDLALDATLRASAPWQLARGRHVGGRLILKVSDLRVKVRARPTRHLILFVVDASRSMGARKRMAQTKAAVLSLLVDAYQKRDRVGLITFGGLDARLVLAPTRSVSVAARELADLPVGGATPLAHGLTLANRVVDRSRRREPGLTPLVVLLTDGRGNAPLLENGQPTADALALADRLGRGGVAGLVIDTEGGPVRLGLAKSLARAWGADFQPLEELGGRALSEAVRLALFRRTA
jgi:magnesium chelatase subunit D